MALVIITYYSWSRSSSSLVASDTQGSALVASDIQGSAFVASDAQGSALIEWFTLPLGHSSLITHYSLLITHHSSLITHYSLLIVPIVGACLPNVHPGAASPLPSSQLTTQPPASLPPSWAVHGATVATHAAVRASWRRPSRTTTQPYVYAPGHPTPCSTGWPRLCPCFT